MVIQFRNVDYENLSHLSRELGIKSITVRDMYKRCLNDHTLFVNNLEEFLSERERINELINVVNKRYNINLKNKIELNKFFNSIKIKRQFLGLPQTLWYKIIYYSMINDYVWLVSRKQSFNYKGIEYKSYIKFIHHYKIITKNLLEELIKNEGNLEKAILKCENDPEFGVVEEVHINGVKYSTVNDACRQLNIAPGRFKQMRRNGLTYQESFDILNKNKENYKQRLLINFPIKHGNLTFTNIDELSKYLGYAKSATYNLIKNLTEEEIFNLSRKQPKKELIFDGKEFPTITSIEEYLSLNEGIIKSTAIKFGLTSEDFINSIEEYAVIYDGRKYYTVFELDRIIDLQKREISNIYNSVLQIKNIDERSKKFNELINDKSKRKSFLFYGDKKYASVWDMSKDLKIGYPTIVKNMYNKNTEDEFQEWLKLHLDRKD